MTELRVLCKASFGFLAGEYGALGLASALVLIQDK